MLRHAALCLLLVACVGSDTDSAAPASTDDTDPAPSGVVNVVVGPTNLDFGEVFVGSSATDYFAVVNQDIDTVDISVAVESDQPGAWSITPASGTAAPGDYLEFAVTVTVSELVSYAGAAVIYDPWQREIARVGLTVRTRVDADGDGFGAERYAGDDCNDDDPAVNPAATEVYYDGVDSNCDGASDYDADGDGFDSSDYGGQDCDDDDPAVAPGAAEVFYDGVDQDCDGASDFDADGDGWDAAAAGGLDCDDTLASVAPPASCWTGDVDAVAHGVLLQGPADARAGAAVLGAADLFGAGPGVVVSGPGEGLERGRAWWVQGPVTAAVTLETGATLLVEGTAGDALGSSMALGDPAGTGASTLLLGAPGHAASGGGVWWAADASGGGAWLTAEGVDELGSTVLAADLDGDGADEVAAGGSDSAAVFTQVATSPTAPWVLSGGSAGASLAAADLDQDGYTDLLVGQPTHGSSDRSAGRVLVVFGSATGLLGPLSAAPTATLAAADLAGAEGSGAALAAGDLSGDAVPDVVFADSQGTVYRVDGPVTAGQTATLDAAAATWTGAGSGALVALADADESGTLDLVLGSPAAGALALWLGDDGAFPSPGSATTPVLHAPVGALSVGADLNADDHIDVVVGDAEAGRAWVLAGPALAPEATASPSR